MSLVCLIAGWALFAASLFVPAVTEGGSSILAGGVVPGRTALLFSLIVVAQASEAEKGGDVFLVLLGLCNLLMLASPVLTLFVRKGPAFRKGAFAVAALLVCSSRFVLAGGIASFLIGFYLWCASFVLVAAGAYLRR